MIIADFIKVKKPETEIVFDKFLLSESSKLKKQIDGFKTAREFGFSWKEQDAFESFSSRLNETYNLSRGKMLAKHGTLPTLLVEENGDVLSKLSESPKVSLSEAKRIADTLNFVIIPFAYLDVRSYKSENHGVKAAIASFTDSSLKDVITPYVICPVQFYSVENHVASGLDLPIYAPPSLVQTFMAIGINVPMFRTMKHEMKQMRNDIHYMDSRIQNLDSQVKNLSTQVQQLANQVQMQLQQAMIREAQANSKLAALESSRFSSEEPMLLGLPNGTGIFDNKWAFMGPCWGPDFEDIVMAAMNLKPIKQQKVLLEKNWGYSNKNSQEEKNSYNHYRYERYLAEPASKKSKSTKPASLKDKWYQPDKAVSTPYYDSYDYDEYGFQK